MPKAKQLPVKNLTLDLANFRTIPQKTESKSIHAMIAINPDWFWALADSLLSDGYLPTDNIIVLEQGKDHIVKEGNRRIAVMKLIHGEIDRKPFQMPTELDDRITVLDSQWIADNSTVPCTVYQPSEGAIVDRIIALAHGKGEKAGRDVWNTVARARHNRTLNPNGEVGLDLLEKYLKHGKTHTADQAARWAGLYQLTVLEEAMKKIAPRLSCSSARDLADSYPKLKHANALDGILRDIGLGILSFSNIRDATGDFAARYGVPPLQNRQTGTGTTGQNSSGKGSTGAAGGASGGTGAGSNSGKGRKPSASATNDHKAVTRHLKKFKPKGTGREKVVTLLNEARTLKIDKHPHSFCFLLRSMFEISAKAYCDDHQSDPKGPKAVKSNGEDRTLIDVLREITAYLTKNNSDKGMQRELHGAMTELAKPDGFLSVTSMNQLVHNRKFTMNDSHISTLFFNIVPLLERMNQ